MAAAYNLYVKAVAEGDADQKSLEITRAVLAFVRQRLDAYAAMGAAVTVRPVSAAALRDPRAAAAMRARGVTRLPAMTTPTGAVYTGLGEIAAAFERNAAAYAAHRRGESGGRAARAARVPDDEDMSDYYARELGQPGGDDDDDESAVGEGGGDMMAAYRRGVDRRFGDTAKSGHRPEPQRASSAPQAAGGAGPRPAGGAAPRPGAAPPAARRDNIGDADEITRTIEKLSRDVGGDRGPAAPPGGAPDDDEAPNPADDLMERAYWERMSESGGGGGGNDDDDYDGRYGNDDD